MITYRFSSKNKKDYKKLRAGQDYTVWSKLGLDIENAVTQARGTIIEIGGPTASGYYFLDKLPLLSETIITSITPTPVAMLDENAAAYVDEVVDGRDLPYKDCSVNMFLMSGMSITND